MKEEPKPFAKPRFAGRKNITLREALDAIPESRMKQILAKNTEHSQENIQPESSVAKKPEEDARRPIILPKVSFISKSQPDENN
ncbi:MAG: hypothetical protein Q7S01_01265 [bacterium]|nr:hypothetical protein [bacterium]